jgi:hypothetical protein
MPTGIGLVYVEGEVRDGYITGRTVLVVETHCELDPASPHYSASEIARITKLAREQWMGRFGHVDIVRLEQAPEELAGVNGYRRTAS